MRGRYFPQLLESRGSRVRTPARVGGETRMLGAVFPEQPEQHRVGRRPLGSRGPAHRDASERGWSLVPERDVVERGDALAGCDPRTSPHPASRTPPSSRALRRLAPRRRPVVADPLALAALVRLLLPHPTHPLARTLSPPPRSRTTRVSGLQRRVAPAVRACDRNVASLTSSQADLTAHIDRVAHELELLLENLPEPAAEAHAEKIRAVRDRISKLGGRFEAVMARAEALREKAGAMRRANLARLADDDTDELPPEADYYVRAPVADARGEAGAEGEDDGGKGTEGGAPRKEPGE